MINAGEDLHLTWKHEPHGTIFLTVISVYCHRLSPFSPHSWHNSLQLCLFRHRIITKLERHFRIRDRHRSHVRLNILCLILYSLYMSVIPNRAQELHILRKHFQRRSRLIILVQIHMDGDLPNDGNLLPFGQILLAVLAQFAPGADPEEVGNIVSLRVILSAVYSDGKSAYGLTVLGRSCFWIPREISDNS